MARIKIRSLEDELCFAKSRVMELLDAKRLVHGQPELRASLQAVVPSHFLVAGSCENNAHPFHRIVLEAEECVRENSPWRSV